MRDSFVEDRLTPQELLPEFRFDLPELQYPEHLNAAAEQFAQTSEKAAASAKNSSRPPMARRGSTAMNRMTARTADRPLSR